MFGRFGFAAAVLATFVDAPFCGAQTRLLNPNLNADERKAFYHLHEGSEIYPLLWLKALQIDLKNEDGSTVTQPFLKGMERYGFLSDRDHPDGLPVGMTSADLKGLEFLGKQIGLNCAACHVGEITHGGVKLRIDGAPNLLDTRSFLKDLADATKQTMLDPRRFVSFLKTIAKLDRAPEAGIVALTLDKVDKVGNLAMKPLGAVLRTLHDEPSPNASLEELWAAARTARGKEEVKRKLLDVRLPVRSIQFLFGDGLVEEVVLKARLMRARIDFLHRLAGVGKNEDTDWGPGRVDAFGSARRFLFDASHQPIHGVSYPHLFDLYRTKWFHYDSNTTTFLERNIGQALGVGAVFDPRTGETSVDVRNLHRLDLIASKLRAPAWPEDVLGKIDREKAAMGRKLFSSHCAHCHSDKEDWSESLSIDTDEGRAEDFAKPTPDGTRFPDAIGAVMARISKVALGAMPEAERKGILDREGVKQWRQTKKYSARPLVGVWATAPYLHNGSVPTLDDLLEKSDKRPRRFLLGSREYDPKRVGYAPTKPSAHAFVFDVSEPGNSNRGHEYGTDLSAADKERLIEYLKTIDGPTKPALDVNDVSILWPVPSSREEAAKLISASDLLADGKSPIWPTEAFDGLLGAALKAEIAKLPSKIDFADKAFLKPSTWKVAGVRFDPSAPGCDTKIVAASPVGSAAQIRLVLQPVTEKDGKPFVHDVTAHLVFSFGMIDRSAGPKSVPDRVAFSAVVNDLARIKAGLKAAGVNTKGPLGVHPGFKRPEFADAVRKLLASHLSESRLGLQAFMGIAGGFEPWIFFAASRTKDAGFTTLPAIALNFRGGDAVMPPPPPKNPDGTLRIATAPLFAPGVGVAKQLQNSLAGDGSRPFLGDVPDIVANPSRTHFFNTDCISCHTESARRSDLKIDIANSMFAYSLPEGISGLDPAVRQTQRWNVRNFGWFPDALAPGRPTVPSVSLRTANEAAESADFINRIYLGR